MYYVHVFIAPTPQPQAHEFLHFDYVTTSRHSYFQYIMGEKLEIPDYSPACTNKNIPHPYLVKYIVL